MISRWLASLHPESCHVRLKRYLPAAPAPIMATDLILRSPPIMTVRLKAQTNKLRRMARSACQSKQSHKQIYGVQKYLKHKSPEGNELRNRVKSDSFVIYHTLRGVLVGNWVDRMYSPSVAILRSDFTIAASREESDVMFGIAKNQDNNKYKRSQPCFSKVKLATSRVISQLIYSERS